MRQPAKSKQSTGMLSETVHPYEFEDCHETVREGNSSDELDDGELGRGHDGSAPIGSMRQGLPTSLESRPTTYVTEEAIGRY